ncbi:MAG: DUF3418 domain-containing protein, partial [Casimicrobium sp.]
REVRHGPVMATYWARWLAEKERNGATASEALLQFRWLIEELHVSLFAQELKTPFPVSAKRLDKIWAETVVSAPRA